MSIDDKELINIDHRDLKLHKHGSKAGKLLSYLTKNKFNPIKIHKLKREDGTTTYNPKDINKIFEDFYTELYSRQTYDETPATQCLEGLTLPNITEEQNAILNAQVTHKEIQRTISNLMKGKAPEPDGYTADFH